MLSPGDGPIQSGDQDRLLRLDGTLSLAHDIREVDASNGYVVAVVGPWGSGKTSILNMLREALETEPTIPVIDFNPWIFSGTSELIDHFFRELSAQLRLKKPKLATVADSISAYGELVSPLSALPVVGAWLDRALGSGRALKQVLERRKGSVSDQRDKLAAELAKIGHPIVVIVDDIDRLESAEIRDIFKLVRLTANFPNTIYVLAFDRARVEEGLTQTGFDGRAYLEKIVQLVVDVPTVPASSMLQVIGESLGVALDGLPAQDRFNDDIWPDVLAEIIRPLISTMRDLNRYSGALRAKARLVGSQIELVDVMALEALRVFLPDVFSAIVAGRQGLTTAPSSLGVRADEALMKAQVDAVVSAGSAQPDVVRATISRLFPMAERHLERNTYDSAWLSVWLRARRIAHPDMLALFLEQTTNDGVHAFTEAERAFAVIDDEEALDQTLRGCNPERIEDIISALTAFEADFPSTAVVPASRVLLNILPLIPDRTRGARGFMQGRFIVARAILRLFGAADGETEPMAVTQEILAGVTSLASRYELVTIVGHREGAGHRLVSVEDAASLEADLRERLDAAPPEELAGEREVLRLLYMPKNFESGKVVHADASHVELAAALLLEARSVVRSQVVGNRRVYRTTRLNWDMLVEVLGGEDGVRRAIEVTRPTADEELGGAIELAESYLDGWRPPE